ncbi:hypothetical protein ASPSYDRAFT_39896 [Aspergillus sydowii CBS 593.65]|uniref:Cysteine-rich transmembrane CYSTM domain-containing protein n=1 Tax=Aspergillus sydowii CBS 593.65 TaxID=1036612 RepID=A0A1L9U0A5_9EURO|nr:uncharacterized protein ASPSYDRAFT_39896 [Aspergillus sydowii CBS 593.65]OJJ65099.1 hypothetical protein ASPSYDRAFT_39896 [Aspergillus sydowii CBS 593.65]
MVSFNPLSLFKSSRDEQANSNPTFDPNTLTMVQPGSPNGPSMNANNNSNGVVSEQPVRQEQMGTGNDLHLRGGGGGGFCCGICAGLACFECCEICC